MDKWLGWWTQNNKRASLTSSGLKLDFLIYLKLEILAFTQNQPSGTKSGLKSEFGPNIKADINEGNL